MSRRNKRRLANAALVGGGLGAGYLAADHALLRGKSDKSHIDRAYDWVKNKFSQSRRRRSRRRSRPRRTRHRTRKNRRQ